MPHVAKALGMILGALAISPTGWGQEAPNRPGDENPNRAAKSKPAARPAPAAPASAPPPPARPARVVRAVPAAPQVQVIFLGNNRNLALEAPKPPIADDLDDLEEAEEAPPAAINVGLNLNAAVLDRGNFDRWVFGDGIDEKARRDHLDRLLSAKLDEAWRESRLDGQQWAKLKLAGLGDIKRLFERVEASRARFDAVRGEFNPGLAHLRQLGPLTADFERGPFGQDSLFAKSLRAIQEVRKAPR